VTILYKIYL